MSEHSAAHTGAAQGGVQPNFGAEDAFAIKSISYMLLSIFAAALAMYSLIAIFVWP